MAKKVQGISGSVSSANAGSKSGIASSVSSNSAQTGTANTSSGISTASVSSKISQSKASGAASAISRVAKNREKKWYEQGDDDDYVKTWQKKYDDMISGINASTKQRNGAWTDDVTGGHRQDYNDLVYGFDRFMKLADSKTAEQYWNNMQTVWASIESASKFYSQWKDADAFDQSRYGIGQNASKDYNASDWGLTDEQAAQGRQGWYETQKANQEQAKQDTANAMDVLIAAEDKFRMISGQYSPGSKEYDEAWAEYKAAEDAYYEADGASKGTKIQREYEATQASTDANTNIAGSNEFQNWKSTRSDSGEVSSDDHFGRWVAGGKTSDSYYQWASDPYSNAGTDPNLFIQQEAAENSWDKLTDDEISVYEYIRDTQGLDAAKDWLDGMKVTLKQRVYNEMGEQAAAEYRNAETAERVLMNAASIPFSVVTTGAHMAESVAKNISAFITGEEYIGYTNAAILGQITTGWRGEAAKDIQEASASVAQNLFGWKPDENGNPDPRAEKFANYVASAYEGTMSMLDSAVSAMVWGNGAYEVMMGVSAYAQRYIEMFENGATYAQCQIGSFLSGVIEGLFEHVSIDVFQDYIIKDRDTFGKWVLGLMYSSLAEGTEEFNTEIANAFVDVLVRGMDSDVSQRVQQLMDTGMSEDDAKAMAYREVLGDAWMAFYSAAVGQIIGGGAFGAGRLTYNVANNFSTGSKIINSESSDINQLAASAAALQNQKASQKLQTKAVKAANAAESYDGKSWLGKLATQYQVGAVDNAIRKQSEIDYRESRSDAFKEAAGQYYDSIDKKNGIARNVFTTAMAKAFVGESMNAVDKAAFASAGGKNTMDHIATKYNVEGKAADIRAGSFVSDISRTVAEGGATLTDRGQMLMDNVTKQLQMSTDDMTYVQNADGELEAATVSGVAGYDNKTGVLSVTLDNGRTVPVQDIRFGSIGERLVYSGLQSLGVTADEGNAILELTKDMTDEEMKTFAYGMNSVFLSGMNGRSYQYVENSNKKEVQALDQETRRKIYDLGVQAREERSKSANVTRRKAASSDAVFTDKHGVKYDFDPRETKLSAQQRATVYIAQVMSNMGIDVRLFASTAEQRKDGMYNGRYMSSDGTIVIDINSGNNAEGIGVFTMAHEITHMAKDYNAEAFDQFAKMLFEEMAKKGIDSQQLIDRELGKLKFDIQKNGTNSKYYGKSETYLHNIAYDEAVATACESMLVDTDAANRIAEKLSAENPGLLKRIIDTLRKFLGRLKEAVAKLSPDYDNAKMVSEIRDTIKNTEGLIESWSELIAGGIQNYNAADIILDADEEASTEVADVKEATAYSYSSLAQAAGFQADMDSETGVHWFVRGGRKVSEITVDDIENSPIGALINYSMEMEDITAEMAEQQKQFFADLCTIAANVNDFNMGMTFAGSSVFMALKANSDRQYGTTYDFPSICTKTQALIDAMSAAMVEAKRGLEAEEITFLADKVFFDGNPIPCPECYVFSRWVGIGGLLDNIYAYQKKYAGMTAAQVAAEYDAMFQQISAEAEALGLSFGKAKGKIAQKVTKEYTKLLEEIEKATNQGETVAADKQYKLQALENQMTVAKAMTWIDTVYFKDASHKKVNPKWNVPVDVLFDLNQGESFAADYPEAWGFRTTQGAGYGKAITPYSEAVIGEGIIGTNSVTNAAKAKKAGTLNNIFLQQAGKLNKDARRILERARQKQKTQAFLGGQRFQSTSDALYENASDYLLAALEMQAMHGMVQVYTKVPGAVQAFYNWGFSTNQSLMPLGGGLDKNGNPVDSDVGGMNTEAAKKNREQYETQGTITIGVNDNHIRKLFNQVWRDFIIPYHASGGKAAIVNKLRSIQDPGSVTDVRSTDYSTTQGDKVLSDEVLRWLGKSDAEIAQIHKVRDARIAILTRDKNVSQHMDTIRGNRFLNELYNRFNGGEWDGVKLAKGTIADHIFPNEFWDKSVTYKDSAKITKDYLEYCDDLGFLHRFSGKRPSNGILVAVKGYDENGKRCLLTDLAYKNGKDGEVEDFFWKVLTDRRMYDNAGNYLEQRYVTLKTTTTDMVQNFAKGSAYGKAAGREYNAEISRKTVDEVRPWFTDGSRESSRNAAENDLKEMQDNPGTFIDSERGESVRMSTRMTAPPSVLTDDDGNVKYVYKAFYAKDGKLYPPMVANLSDEELKGSGTLKGLDTPVGIWLNADIGMIGRYKKDATEYEVEFRKFWAGDSAAKKELQERMFAEGKLNDKKQIIQENRAYIMAEAEKVNAKMRKASKTKIAEKTGDYVRTNIGRLGVENAKGGGTLSFRPGWHLGEWPDAKQFSKDSKLGKKTVMPDGLVFAKCEIAGDVDYQLDAMGYGMKKNGAFDRTLAGLPMVPEDGYYLYRTNVDPTTAPWYITGSMRVVEILDDDDCAEICAQYGVKPNPRESGKKINLADYGLQRGPVTPVANPEAYVKNQRAYQNEADLEEALSDPRFEGAYTKYDINFDNDEIRKEFARNGQDPEYYRQMDTARKNGTEFKPQKNTGPEDGVRNSLRISYAKGNEIIEVNPRTVTDKDVLELLYLVKGKKLDDKSYVPILSYTPGTVLDTLHKFGYDVEDRPLIMRVKKAKLAMMKPDADSYNTVHKHGLEPEQLLNIVKGLEDPVKAYFEHSHIGPNGKVVPDRAAFLVKSNAESNDSAAVIEFDVSVPEEYVTYDDTNWYNMVVTAFNPNIEDYSELLKGYFFTEEIEIVKRHQDYSDLRQSTGLTENKMPSDERIQHDGTDVNKRSSRNTDVVELDLRSEYEIENGITRGVNINDSAQAFTEEILDGYKTEETRFGIKNPNGTWRGPLDSLIGKRVAIVRTGVGDAKIVGYVTITGRVRYDSPEEFWEGRSRHLVTDKTSDFYMKNESKPKFGYTLSDPVRADTARKIDQQGRSIRKIYYSTRNNQELHDFLAAHNDGSEAGLKAIEKEFEAQRKAIVAEYRKQGRELQKEADRDMSIMTREFLRIVKEWEKQVGITEKTKGKLDAAKEKLAQQKQVSAEQIKDLKEKLAAEAKSHKEDNAIWQQEFNRLLSMYAQSGRDIQKLQATIQRQKETARKKIESRRMSETKAKIQDTVKKLNQMLLHPTKSSHVPTEMREAVAGVLQAINMDTTGAAKIGLAKGKLDQAIARAAKLAQQLDDIGKLAGKITPTQLAQRQAKIAQALQNARDEVAQREAWIAELERRQGNFTAAWAELQKAYASIASSKDAATQVLFDEATQNLIAECQKAIGGTPLAELNLDQLNTLSNTLKAVLHAVRDGNKAKLIDQTKTAVEIMKLWRDQMNDADVATGAVAETMKQYFQKQMSPDVFFRYITGYAKNGIGEKLSRMFMDGTVRMLSVQRDYATLFEPLFDDKAAMKEIKDYANQKKLYDIGLTDQQGNTVKLTKGMVLQVYRLLMQEDSYNSMLNGASLRLPTLAEYYKGNIQYAYGSRDIEATLSGGGNKMELQDMQHTIDTLKKEAKTADENRKTDIQTEIQDIEDQRLGLLAGRAKQLDDMRQTIEDMLTATDKTMLDMVNKWYDYAGKLMSDTFEELNGFPMTRVSGYAEIHRDTSTIASQDTTTVINQVNLANNGNTIERVASTKPILLTDMLNDLQSQQARTSKYVGFALVQRDFNRVYKMPVDYTGDNTIQSLIGAKFGQGDTALTKAGLGVTGTQWIENLVQDVSGNRAGDDNLSFLYNSAAASTLSLNLRVAVSQLASIPTAAAEVGWVNAAKGLIRGAGKSLSKAERRRLAQENVYFWQRYRGEGAMREIGDLKNARGFWGSIANSKAGKALLNWCQEMDVTATGSIMYAMAEAAAESRGISRNDAHYREKVNEIYTDIIRRTQPNYTTTERSDLLRDKRTHMKLLTMYKTQSNQNMNILMSGVMEYRSMQRQLKEGKNGVTLADVQAARRKMINGATAVIIGGNIAFALLRMLANMLMYNWDPYEDDETGEVNAAGILSGILSDTLSGIANMVTGGSLVYDAISKAITGDKYYGIEDSALSTLSNVVTSGQKMLTEIFSQIQNGEADLGELADVGKSFTTNAMTAIGVPVKNAGKYVTMVEGWYGHFTGASSMEGITASQKNARLVQAYRTGDDETFGAILAEYYATTDQPTQGRREDAVASSVKTYLQKQYIAGNVTEDEVVGILAGKLGTGSAADVRKDIKTWDYKKETGDSYSNLQTNFLRGKVTYDEAVEARMTYGGETKAEASATVNKWQMELDTGHKYSEIKSDYVSGKITAEQARSWMVKYGGISADKAKNTVAGYLCERETGYTYSGLQDAYLEGKISADKAAAYYQKYSSSGVTKDEAVAKVQEWKCEKETGTKYSDIKSSYVSGKLSYDKAVRMLVMYGGLTEKAAKERIDSYLCEKETGYSYSELKTYWKRGTLTTETAITMLMKYGGKTRYKAEKTVKGWAND